MDYQLPVFSKYEIKKDPLISIVIPEEKPKTPEPPKRIEHIIKPGETLTSISKLHSVDLSRLWSANTQLTNPDRIEPDTVLNVPHSSEVLAERPFPATVELLSSAVTNAPSGRSSVSGNTYYKGFCTWYAKNMRPDMPNNLGNADTWGIRAEQQGFVVSSNPTVGAVAVAITYMHVGIVQAIEGNKVLISEMNYNGFGVVSQRWTSASEFEYIQ